MTIIHLASGRTNTINPRSGTPARRRPAVCKTHQRATVSVPILPLHDHGKCDLSGVSFAVKCCEQVRLAFLDTYRTLSVMPEPPLRRLLEGIREMRFAA